MKVLHPGLDSFPPGKPATVKKWLDFMWVLYVGRMAMAEIVRCEGERGLGGA